MIALLAVLLAAQDGGLLIDQEQDEQRPVDPGPARASGQGESPLKKIGEFLSHPFRDNGRRFDRYPYAGDGPYFLTRRFSDKMFAVMMETTLGRITHENLSFGTEVIVAWSSGCDARIDSNIFEEVVNDRSEKTQLHHVHLDIGTFADPSPVDYTLGIGFGALDSEERNGFGPSVRAAVRGFPFRPISFRLDATVTWFREETIADLRGEVGLHIGRLAITAGVRSMIRTEADDWIGPNLGFAVYF